MHLEVRLACDAFIVKHGFFFYRSLKPSLPKIDSAGKLLELSRVTKVQSQMPKSNSLPDSTSGQVHSIQNSPSEAATSASNSAVAARVESQSLRSANSFSSRLNDSGTTRSQEDGNVSSDSIGGTNGKEKKKKFALFKRHKAT